MSNAIAKTEQTGLATVDVASELPAIFKLATALTKASGFLPQHLKNEGEIAAVILAGRELGIPPMASIRGIKMVKGNVTLDASLQLGCMIRAGAKVSWEKDGSDGEAVLVLERPGQQPYRSRFTMDMAKRAGLNGDNWQKHPAAMLRARCVTAAGKAYFADVMAGVYLPDEIPSDEAPQKPVRRTLDDVAAAPAAKPEPATEYDQATGEVVQGELEPAGGQVGFRDEYGLELPAFSCPRVSSGEHEGKLYTDIPAQLLRAMSNSRAFKSSANDAQRAWATYLVARDDAQKASGQ